ncbi:MAG: non-ribosomal peptide synthetase, partial [Tumebacillaceae bacterium]
QTLLHRYTGQADIVVGTPIAGRNRKETEGLIGFFINTLVLRTSFEGNPTFTELLQQVRETSLEAFANQDVPFEKLVDELKLQRDPSRTPLFQTMFILQNTPFEEVKLPGLTLLPVEFDNPTAKFDLSIELSERGEELVGLLNYNTDLFDRATIARLAQHYLNLLQGIADDAKQFVSVLPILTEAERHQLVGEWNDTMVEYPQDVCLHQLFEQQVARTPDAVAVVFEEQELTYRELNEQANRLAHYLQKQQVGPEVLVGVCMERSLEMVISLYGILKAGGAYVPIDPTYPSDRLSYLLEDSQIQVLLTQEKWVDTLPDVSVPLICFDRAEELLAGECTENLPCAATAEHAAYMIYTSGSTGKPKGVLNTHKGIVNRLLWMQDEYKLTSDDRVLQKTPFSFDVSVWEFFWPLLTGARLVVARPEGHRDSHYLVETIQRYEITTLHFVPSMLQLFLEETGVEQCRSIRQVMTSGEALPYELQKRFFACLDAELHNLYGPTEAAVDVTYWECESDSTLNFVPIGRPIANTTIFILDQHLQPVPIGVAGELHIGGVQVARGYHNRPELTAEKFIPNPFAPGERLYKTGDLARFLADGNIQYLGRLDHQVKIRGQRVELGEIEEVLMQQTGVWDAVTVVREDVPGDQRLVAYLVVQEAEAFDVNELRGFLKKRLPDYMVPAHYMLLEQLPLTPNGKVDRKALPAPDGASLATSREYVAPTTPTEQLLAGLWEELLSVEQISVYDSFFELGGHSLLATRVVSQIRKSFAVELPVRTLFEHATISELAVLIDRELHTNPGAQAPSILPEDRKRDIPLSFAQERLFVLDQMLSNKTVYNMPFAVRMRGALEVSALESALQEIIKRHESLRTTFVLQDGIPMQRIAKPQPVALPIIDLRELPTAEREAQVLHLIQADVEQPFDLQTGPLVRFLLLQLDDVEHVLMANMHHIISDGWSMGIL